MKRAVVLVIILLIFAASTPLVTVPAKASADQWITRASIPVAMDVMGAATVNGQIYVFGEGANEQALTYAYNPDTNSWVSKAPMPASRFGFAVAAYQDKIYVIGGITGYRENGSSIFTGANEMYNPATDTWTTKTAMPTARAEFKANVDDDKIYAISGLIANLPGPILTNSTEIYDPSTSTWSEGIPIPTPVFTFASAVLDSKIYVIGGQLNGFTAANQIFNPATGNWSLGAPLPTLTVQAVGVATTGTYAPERVYVIGGRLNGPVDSTQIYDPANDTWTFGSSFPTTHDYVTEYLAATVLNDKLYVVGGLARANEGFYELTEQYIPADYNATVSSPSPTASATTIPSPIITEFPA